MSAEILLFHAGNPNIILKRECNTIWKRQVQVNRPGIYRSLCCMTLSFPTWTSVFPFINKWRYWIITVLPPRMFYNYNKYILGPQDSLLWKVYPQCHLTDSYEVFYWLLLGHSWREGEDATPKLGHLGAFSWELEVKNGWSWLGMLARMGRSCTVRSHRKLVQGQREQMWRNKQHQETRNLREAMGMKSIRGADWTSWS